MLQTLLQKWAPAWADLLTEETIPCPAGWGGVYALTAQDGHIHIRGDCALSRAVALRRYLEEACGLCLAWAGTDPRLPSIPRPPLQKAAIEGKIPAAERGFFVPLSYAYSPCWWSAERWEDEVDILALYGVNRPLLLLGSEYAWYQTLRAQGVSREYALDTMSGPPFWPRQWAGQLAGLYAPVDALYLKSRGQLGRRVADRMRAWGMQPVFPGFTPVISVKLSGLLKGVQKSPLPGWNGFAPLHLLAPDCPAFTALGEAYHQQLKAILGETDVFFDVLEERCSALHLACASLSAQYTTNATPAYAIETPLSPPASQTSLRGDYAGAAAFVAAPGSRIHCGAAEPEANPLLLTLQLEALTRETPAALEPWLRRYASNRYGTDAPAAAVFAACGAVFAACGVVGAGFAIDSSFCRRPNTVAEPAAPWGGVAAPGDPSVWIEAARQLLAERKNAPEACLAALRYDLCDFLRQAMSERAGAFYEKAMEGYAARDARLFERSANDFLRLLENCDRLLCTVEAFSLPARLAKARGCAKLDAERNNFELAVLAQHSIYGGKGSRLRESHLLHGVDWREWGGLLGSLHYRRWELFFSLLAKRFKGKPLSLETKRKPLGRSEYETTRPLRQMAELERAWLRDYHPAEAEPGNTEETAEECLRVILH